MSTQLHAQQCDPLRFKVWARELPPPPGPEHRLVSKQTPELGRSAFLKWQLPCEEGVLGTPVFQTQQ